ncbi:MAG TPA: hypothetical protein VL357_08190 [Rariglobus sp.]|jgi:hypothetical protein|nr:hypothetical protein [Rariglobus sp.]
MLLSVRLLSTFLLLSVSLSARTWTNTQGRTIEAEFVKASGDTVTIRRADGLVFDLPLVELSGADRDYVTAQSATAGTAGQSTEAFKDINTLLGLDLLADDNLWDDTPSDVAKRLNLSLEGKTPYSESYRAYPRKELNVLGARTYMISLQAADGKITALTLMFANRGDFPAFRNQDSLHFPSKSDLKDFDQALKSDYDTISAALTAKLGDPQSKMGVGGLEPHRRSLRWEWGVQTFIASHDDVQMVSLKIVPTNRTNSRLLSDEQVRRMLKERLDKRPNGDVIVDQIPMVDQGPKGYCVPATFERYLRYVGIPADMYELAAAGGTDFGGGTNFSTIAAGLDRYIRRQGRHLDQANLKFNINGIARYLDEGRPIIWGLYSTKAFNEISNTLTDARKAVSDWSQWKKAIADTDISSLHPDSATGHACLIIGYNRATNEIAFTDSWGPRFAERWVPLAAAQKISQDEFWVIAW